MHEENSYESQSLLAEYLLLHYGNKKDIFASLPGPTEALNFPKRSVHQLIDKASSPSHALDLGCAVGRSTFELSQLAKKVIGIDFSSTFITAAKTLLKERKISCKIPIEGNIFNNFNAYLPQNLSQNQNIHFEVGDACNLRPDLGSFDLVHAANLLCRLPRPQALLNKLSHLVNPGGQLLLTTPFTWLHEYTPTEHWIGAQNAKSQNTRDSLIQKLSVNFTLEKEINLPFIIREHARKFQYTIAWGTRWRRLTSQ
ncbi:MAG: putative 4-mercaptohistidine N1-methyltransferase [Chthoniobacterales bacterium]